MNELVETAGEGLPVIADDQLVALVAQAEKRIEAFNKLKGLALRLTNPSDWVAQGDRPYMQSSAAEKIGSFFGVSWHIDEPKVEYEEGGHFTYTYQGEFVWRGNSITAIGTRSSKDGFFKKYGYGSGKKEELPPSEIDKGDVKKSAYTNCIGNGVTRSLGIRNLTWEDLSSFANITKEQVSSVDYKKNGKQQDGIKSEGAQTATIGIADIRKQTGTNAKTKKPWTKFIVKGSDGVEYGTFSETTANGIKDARDAGLQIELTFVAGQYGNDIESFKKIEVPEREAGQEG